MEVFCLRIRKTVAGRTFPFDRIYLVRHDDRAVVERLFRYSLVMAVEGALREMLAGVAVDQYANRTHNRDDTLSALTPLVVSSWHELLGGADWVMAVPLLPKWMAQNVPQYLTAERWFSTKTIVVKGKGKTKSVPHTSPYRNRSYLQTPYRKIRPICVVCPRMILHQNGECQVGDKICFESLPLSMINHFEEGVRVPEAETNVLEPEENEMLARDETVSAVSTRDALRVIQG